MEATTKAGKAAEIRRQLFGEGADILENRKNIDSELIRTMHEFAFGEIFARPRFSLKQRELLALMALIVLDRDAARRHIKIALGLGWEKEDIMEVIATAVLYGGFPVAVRALHMADEVFQEWDESQETKR